MCLSGGIVFYRGHFNRAPALEVIVTNIAQTISIQILLIGVDHERTVVDRV